MFSLKLLLVFGISSLSILAQDVCSLKTDVPIVNVEEHLKRKSGLCVTFRPSLYCTEEDSNKAVASNFTSVSSTSIFNEDQLLEEEVHFRTEYQVFPKKRVHKERVVNSSSVVLYNYETKPVVIGVLHCSRTSPGETNAHTDYYEPAMSYCNKALLSRFYFGIDIIGSYNYFGVDRLSSHDSSPYLSPSTETHVLRTARGENAASREELTECLEKNTGESLDDKTLLCLKGKGVSPVKGVDLYYLPAAKKNENTIIPSAKVVELQDIKESGEIHEQTVNLNHYHFFFASYINLSLDSESPVSKNVYSGKWLSLRQRYENIIRNIPILGSWFERASHGWVVNVDSLRQNFYPENNPEVPVSHQFLELKVSEEKSSNAAVLNIDTAYHNGDFDCSHAYFID